ncbi:hypothetical protein GCM10023199_57430 [Actinomycetospora chibensis]
MQGLFVDDTRVVSGWSVDTRPRVALEDDEHAMTFVLSSSPHRSQMRVVGAGEPATTGTTFRHGPRTRTCDLDDPVDPCRRAPARAR